MKLKTYYLVVHNATEHKELGTVNCVLIGLGRYKKDAKSLFLQWGDRPNYPASVYAIKSKLSFDELYLYFKNRVRMINGWRGLMLDKETISFRAVRFMLPKQEYIHTF